MRRRDFLKSLMAAAGAGLLAPAPLMDALTPAAKRAAVMEFTAQDLAYANYLSQQIWAGLLEVNLGKEWGERYRVRVLPRFKETEEGLIEVPA